MTHSPNLLAAEFLQYNRWANLKLIDACGALSPEQLVLDAPGVYGNIYETLVHILRSEAGYYRRISGVRMDAPFAWEARPPLGEMRAYAAQVGSALVEAAEQMQTTDTLPRDWNDDDFESYPPRFKAVAMLIQVINHGIEHRTNITTILAQNGLDAPDLAGWEYLRLNPERLGGF